ncbi:hypothetical protein [Christiangramia sediminis]|uniref:Uncharacterized protein n=1 Tax=Christiangramia sediminis TaxID=2881336 RepID=A0A9X1RY42_9FLAO|nr:hypothetical protein [Christiangramia sediminis]MCB7481567.1 hypothetical protein [Christiangramia sediminis]
MKKSIMTVAAIAMVLSFSSCKETTAETTEETVEEVSTMNATQEEIIEEETQLEVEQDSTTQVDSAEITPAEVPGSDKI